MDGEPGPFSCGRELLDDLRRDLRGAQIEADAGELAAVVFEGEVIGFGTGFAGTKDDFHGAGAAVGSGEGDGVGIVVVAAIEAADDYGIGTVEIRKQGCVDGEVGVLGIKHHIAHRASPPVSGYVGCAHWVVFRADWPFHV